MMVPPDTGYHHSKGVLHNSMVKQVRLTGKTGEAEERTYGYAIRIPQVGRLYLGEVFTSADTKRLSMLRLELGSPVTGTLAAAGPYPMELKLIDFRFFDSGSFCSAAWRSPAATDGHRSMRGRVSARRGEV